MEYDEEKREEQDQFARRGDYSPHNPDLAVANIPPGPMSTENQLLMMTRANIKLQAQNKALLQALEALYKACPPASPYETGLFRALAQAMRAINAAKETP